MMRIYTTNFHYQNTASENITHHCQRCVTITSKRLKHLILFIDFNETCVGYLLGFNNPSFCANGYVSWIEEIFVEQAHRKRGMRKLLMKEFEFWALNRGSKSITLVTRKANKFYESLDYKPSAIYFLKKLRRKP